MANLIRNKFKTFTNLPPHEWGLKRKKEMLFFISTSRLLNLFTCYKNSQYKQLVHFFVFNTILPCKNSSYSVLGKI